MQKKISVEIIISLQKGFPCGPVVKNLPANAGDTGSIPGSGRSLRGGNGNPLQYSCLGNPTDREAWRATAHAVAKSRTQLASLQKREGGGGITVSFFSLLRQNGVISPELLENYNTFSSSIICCPSSMRNVKLTQKYTN